MDTGFVHLLDRRAAGRGAEPHAVARRRLRGRRLRRGRRRGGAGARRHAGAVPVRGHRSTSSPPTSGSPPSADRFIGFELSPVFHPDGRIWDLDTYRAVLGIPQCIGAKHSSLERQPEWDRLRLRDEVRPDFLVLTGNDLAIDMVMYGSDYLLGLSTFAPAEFAARDRCWADGRRRRLPPPQRRAPVARHHRLPPAGARLPPRRRAVLPAARVGRQRRHPGGRAAPSGVGARAARAASLAALEAVARGERRDFPQVKTLKRADAFLAHLDDARRHACPSPTRPTSTRWPRPIEVAGRPLRQPLRASCRWRGGTAPTTGGRPTSCAGAGSASARAAPGSCGAARPSPCAPTGGPTRHQLCLGPSSADDLAELHALLDPEQVTGLQLTHSGRWSVEPRPGPRRSAARRAAHRARAHRRPSSTTSPTTTSPPPASRRTPASTSST